MVSDFRKKKYLHVFNTFLDHDKNGSIEKQDIDLLIKKLSQYKGWSAGDAKFKEAQDTWYKIWEGMRGQADKDNDGKITADEWIGMWDEYSKNPNAASDWQKLYQEYVFKLEDSSNDGSIAREEQVAYLSQFGLNKDEVGAAFDKMAKGKPSLNLSEFQQLWKEYFSSDDTNASGNYFFGKSSF